MPLQQLALAQSNALTALREGTCGRQQVAPITETRDAADFGVQPADSIETVRQEPSCPLLQIDSELNTIEEF